MEFAVTNRFTGSVQFKADIDCADDASISIKLGLAVRWAIKSDANLSRANLSGANLSGANLIDANLSDANLSGAYLGDANLSDAYLSGANLSGAYLSDANLSDANLSGAYLGDANLSDAYLGGANLGGANLSGANLSGANLGGANLIGAYGIAPQVCTPLLMLLDQPGPLRAYKLVNNKEEGPFNGGLKYVIGKSVNVSDANIDPQEQCGAGINVATLDWCLKEWRPGYHILIVEFDVKDIACIPTATDGKFRLKRCEVIAEKELDFVALGLVRADKKESA